MRTLELGGLTCRVAGGTDREGGGDGPVVILLHGFGAPGDDLVPFWRVLGVPRGTRFVFPAAPLALEAGFGAAGASRAWWLIDMAALERAIVTGEHRDLTSTVPEGLEPSRHAVRRLIDDVVEHLAADPRSIVLGGFSQGAMLSLDVALHDDRPLAGLILFSGTLLAEKVWTPRLAARAGLRVFQSHGALDPLLPFAIAERLRDLLIGAGLEVEFVPFRGQHEIPPPVLQRLDAWMKATLPEPEG